MDLYKREVLENNRNIEENHGKKIVEIREKSAFWLKYNWDIN